MDKEEQYGGWCIEAITSLFDKDNQNYKCDLEDIDATAFFTGFFIAYCGVYKRLTNNQIDLLDGVALVNRLTVQRLLDRKEGSK